MRFHDPLTTLQQFDILIYTWPDVMLASEESAKHDFTELNGSNSYSFEKTVSWSKKTENNSVKLMYFPVDVMSSKR